MNRIVVVSNRTPSSRQNGSSGGLALGLQTALRGCDALWVGWSGRTTEDAADDAHCETSDGIAHATIDLTPREFKLYYAGFANRALWPLHHGRSDLVHFEPREFACYREVNARFARSLSRLVSDDDLVWVHDFHLTFVGSELRRLGVGSPIGFFFHVPFPGPDAFCILPCHEEMIRALSAYDLVGFQTENDLRNFRDLIVRNFGAAVGSDGTVFAFGRRFRIGTFPIGIDPDYIAGCAAAAPSRRMASTLKNCFQGRLGIIGVDRLDYSKGLPNRLLAYEKLLEKEAAYRKRTFLLQIAAPSRESVPEYSSLKAELETLAGRVNARYAELDWTPVRYLNRPFDQARLAHLFRSSRVGFVTPLCDGMNLVAKEYVAAQDPDDPGVLVLSQFAGAAERLTSALIVNPYDVDGMADALRQALEMPREERRARWSDLIEEVRAHDVYAWRESFVAALDAAPRDVGRRTRSGVIALSPQDEAA